MTPEEIWRTKSDDQLVAASRQLDEYTDDGRRIILAEVERRRASGQMGDVTTSELADDDTDSPSDPPDAGDGLDDVSRLWRGYVSLPRTYWVWGVLGGFVWLVATASVGEEASLPGLVVALLAFAYYVFISVAIWRSAGRYGGRRLWAYLARFAVILAAVGQAGSIFLAFSES